MQTIEMRTMYNGVTENSEPFDYMAFATTTDKKLNLDPNSRYAVQIIKIKDGYRLVTDEEKERYPKPREVILYFQGKGYWTPGHDSLTWPRAVICAVPLAFIFELEPTPLSAAEEKVNAAMVLLEQAQKRLYELKQGLE